MKTKNKVKSYAIGLAFSSLITSCGSEPLSHTKDDPFVVGKIEKIGDNEWRYERQKWRATLGNMLSIKKQSITTDYEIDCRVGDTLLLMFGRRTSRTEYGEWIYKYGTYRYNNDD